MENFSFKNVFLIIFILLLTLDIKYAHAQRIYAGSQTTGASGVLCLGCTVTSPANAADGNLETFSTLNVTVGLAASTYQNLIFPGAVAGGTPVTVKFGSGDKLLSLTALGAISLQAYNGTTAIGQPVAANTLLTALSNNNQVELSITPSASYDRIRVTLNGGLLGALGNLYLYEAFYNGSIVPACNTAIDELNGISSALLGLGANVGGVQNPQLAIDGDPTTASTLNAGVGLAGAYAQQTVIFSKASVLGDSIKLILGVPQSLLSAGVLSNISVTTYNGNTSNNDQTAVNSSLLTLTLLNLNNNIQTFAVTIAPTKVFDRVQLTLGGGIANVLSTLNFYDAQVEIPAPVISVNTVATTNAAICAGGTVTFNAAPITGTTVNWYAAATGGSPLATGNSFTTPALSATTSYYVTAMRAGCSTESPREKVTATVTPLPVAPVVAASNINVCAGQTGTFTTNSVAGVTVNWYDAATAGNLVGTGNTFTTPALAATTSYYAEAVNGTCTSTARTQVTATVVPLPANPALIAASVTVCNGDAGSLMVSNPVAGVTYNWYDAATGGNLVGTGTTFTSPALTATTSYYVEAANATGCTSAQRAQGTVTVSPVPADPTATATSTSIAAGQTTTINVTNPQAGITYNWYTSATAGASVFTGTSYTTPALYAPTTYYIGAVNANGCTSANRTPVSINVIIDTNAPCSFANTQTNDVNGICIGCTVTNPALSVDADTTTATTINVLAGLVGGYAEQQLVFQQPGFAGDTIKLGLQNPTGLLSAAALGQITVTFFNGATQGASYALNNNLISVNLLGGASNKYVVYVPATAAYDRITIRVNGTAAVANSLNIYYASQQFPKPVFNPTAPEICNGSTATINITSPANGTFTWYTTPTGGTSINTGASFTTPALTSNTTYYVAYSRGSCAGTTRFPIQVLVDGVPAAPVVTSQNVTITSGQTATLTANAANGATVQWYSSAAGGTPLATGNTFTTPVLTQNTTYYAGSALGNCVSATTVPVQVTVNPIVIPDISVTPSTTTVNPGESTTITASSTTPGTVFNWYTTPTGGTSIFTGSTFTTPPLFANTTYYAEASVPSTGAVSATRASATITVNQATANPVACDPAVNQTNTTSGVLCVGCAINNPGGAIDNDRNTFSQLTVPVGLVNTYAQQTLQFANAGMAGDSVVVELGVPGSLLSATVLSQISLATYNGATYNNDRFNVDGSTLTITLLNNTNRFRLAFKAVNAFDRVEVRLNAALAGVFSTLNIYDATEEVAAPVIATANTTICQNSAATLTATVPTGVTVKWYADATGGSPLATGPTFTTPALTTTTVYYAEASRTSDGCTQAVRTPASVTVTPLPAAPTVTNNVVTVCTGSTATFTVNPVTGVTYNWYTAAIGGSPVATGSSFTTAPLTANATYYVEATGSSCISASRTEVDAMVTPLPDAPIVANANVSTCSGSTATFNVNPVSGVTYNWYTAATGGTPVATGTTFTTSALTATTSFYAEAVSGSCTSASRTQVTATVTPLPDAPVVANANVTVCSGSPATFAVTPVTGVTYSWYTTPTGGTAIATGNSFTTDPLTATTSYYVEAAGSSCNGATRTQVTATVTPIPDAPTVANQNVTINSGQTATLNATAANGATVQWFTAASGGTPIATGDSYTTPALTASTTFYAGSAAGSCVSTSRTPVNVTVNAVVVPDVAVTPSSVTVDPGQTATLTATSTTPGAVFNWYTTPTGGTPVATGSTYTTPPQFANTTFYAEATVPSTGAVSSSRAAATITVNQSGVSPVACDAATSQTNTTSGLLCVGCAVNNAGGSVDADRNTFAQLSVPVGLVNSYAQQTLQFPAAGMAGDSVIVELGVPGSLASVGVLGQISLATYNGATYNNDRFNVNGSLINVSLISGTSRFRIAFLAGSAYDRVEVRLNSAVAGVFSTLNVYDATQEVAAPVIATANTTICAGSTATLTATVPTGVTVKWYTSVSGGTAVATGATFTTPALAGTTTYYAEASRTSDGCTQAVRTPATVTVTPLPGAPAVANNNVTVCSGSTATFNVVPVTGVTYNWYTAATGGTAISTGNSFTTAALTATTNYYVEAANGTCTSTSRTQVTATVTPLPAAPIVANANVTTCAGSTATFAVTPITGITYNWYTAATGGTPVATGDSFTTAALTATTSYYVEAANGTCTSPGRTQVTATVTPLPDAPVVANNNVTVCSGSAATFTVTPVSGITYNWYTAASGGTPVATGNSFTTAALTATTNYFVEAASGTCTSASRTQVTASVTPVPAVPTVANANQTICSGTQATFNVTASAGITYNWYTAATGGTPIFTGNSYTTDPLTATTSYYVEAADGSCASTGRTQVTATVTPLPAAPTVANANVTVCSGNTATFNVTPAAGVTYNWYVAATGGSPIATGNSFTTDPLTTTTSYFVEASSASCTSPSRTEVTATVNPTPSTPVVANSNVNVCSGSAATFMVNPISGVTYNWYTTATGGTAVATGNSFTTAPLTVTATYYVEAANGSCTSTNRTQVTATVSPVPDAPVVTSQNVTINSGQTATLTATASNGATVQWFNVATGGSPIATGNTYTTPVLTSNTTYYAGSALGSCVSATTVPVTVTVSPVVTPDVTVTPAAVTVDPGQTVTLTATSTTQGAVFNWYTSPTGGTSIHTGATFTTPAEFANTTYYAEASVPSTGAVSSSRAASVITVNQSGVSPVACDAATAQTSATSGVLCVGCEINNPGGSVDADRNTFAQLSVPVGLVNSYAQQTLQFPTPGAAGDSVIVELGVPGSLASASVLGQISVATYNGATFNNDRVNVNGSLINISLLNGTSRFRVAFKVNSVFDRVEVRLNSAVAGVFSTLNVYDATESVPAPVISATNTTICQGSTATLTATVPADATVKWYTSVSGGTPVFTGATFTTPALAATTTYYAEASRTADGCVQAVRNPATVTVTPTPAAPTVANNNVNVCSGSTATFAVTPATGVTYNWYTAATGGTAIASGNSFTTPALTATTSYYAEAVSSTCTSATRTQVTAVVTPLPAAPVVANNNVTICSGSTATFDVTGVAGVTYNWYTAATGGTPVASGTSFTTGALTSTTNYYVEAENGSCSSTARTQVTATVNPTPVNPVVANNNVTVCSGSTATFNVTPVTGVTYNWYASATGGASLHTGNSYTTDPLTATTNYYVEAVNGTCTSTGRTQVTATVAPTPAAPVVTSQNVTITSGQTATLNANATSGATVQWFTAATGGTPVATGNSYTTQALTATTTFYAGAATGSCVSDTRTPVTVTVNPVVIPDVAVTPAAVTVDPGQTTTLTATSTTPGAVFNWFTSPTGGTSIHTGATFTTPPEFANTTYYAEASVPSTGAVSSSRAAGVVTVNQSGVSPVACDAAVSQTSATSGVLCVGCAINNPAGSVDADRNTFAQLSVPVGLVNSYAQQTLQFANPGIAGDSVIVELGVPGSLASVSVLGQVSIATYNGATYNNDRFSVNGSTINISLLSGTSRFRVAFKAGSTFDRVEVRLNSAVAGVFSTLNIYDAVQEVPAPVITTANTTVCQGSTATLTATVPSDVTVKWYTSVSGGTPVFTGATFTTPALTATTTYYAEASRTTDGCAQAVRTPATVTVTPTPATPVVANNNVTICSGSTATFAVTPVTGVTYNWYAAATGGTTIASGTSFTTPALTATTSYYVEASSGTCTSATRTQVTATVAPTPAAPVVASQNVTITSGQTATLNATATNGATVQWFTAATGGVPIATGNTYTTPALTSNTTYYAGTSLGSCVSASRVAVNVTVNPVVIPDVTVTPPTIAVNAGQTATFTASSTTPGAVFNWYTTPTGGTSIFTGATFTTPAEFANTTYYAEASVPSTGAVSASRGTGTVTVNATGSNPVACDAAIDQTNATSGVLCIGCAVNNAAGAVDNDRNTFAQLNVPVGLVNGYAQQTLRFANTGIAGDSVIIELGIPGSLASVGVLNQINVTTYNGTTSNNDSFNVNGSTINISLLSGTSRFRVAFVAGHTFDRVQIRLNAALVGAFNTLNIYDATQEVAAPTITSTNATVCAGSTATLTATATSDATIRWYAAPTGGTPLFTGANFTTPVLTATTTYYAEASRTADGCTQAVRTPATVTVTPTPVAPVVANNNVSVCAGQTATFTTSSVAGVTVNWYSAATGGTLLHTGNTFTTDAVNATTSYYAEAVAAGGCTSPARTQVTATVVPAPANPTISTPNVTICSGGIASLSVSSPQAGITYNWYDAATGGNLVGTGSSFTTPALTSTTSYYVEAVNANGCMSTARAQGTVTVSPTPTAPTLAANSTSVAAGQPATIAVTNAQTGITYNWYTSATAGSPVFTGTTYTTPALYAPTTYYVGAANATGCTSATRTPITINVIIDTNAPCTFANVQTNDVNGICVGCNIANPALSVDADTTTASTLNVLAGLAGGYAEQMLTFQQPGFAGDTVKLSLQNPNGTLSAGLLGQITVTFYNGTTAGASYALNNNLLVVNLLNGASNKYNILIPANAAYDRIQVRFTGTATVAGSLNIYYAQQLFPTKVTFNPVAPEVCKGSSAVISITSPTNGTFNWYTTPTGGTSLHTGASYTTPALASNTTYYVEYSRGSCSGATRFPIQVLVDDVPGAPVVTTQNVTITSGQTATLAATASNGGTIEWYTAATGGTPVATGATFTTPPLTANTTYYAGTALGNCQSATRTPAVVTVNPIVIPDVAVNPVTIAVNPGESTSFTATSTTPGAVFNWFTTPTGGTSIFTGPTFTTPAEFANTIYYAEASIPSTGAKSATRASGTVTVNQTGSSPVACDPAIDQTNTTSGVLCVGCSINNPGGSVDADRNTFAQLNVPVGLVNSYAQQTLRFANTGLAGDSVIVELGTPASLASVSVLGQISIATYNGSTYNNDRFNVNGSTLNITLLNGTNRFRVAFKAGASFDRVEVRLNAAAAGVFNTLNIYDAVQEVPAPTITTTNVTACAGSTATLTATAPADVTIRWYASPNGGSPLFTGATFVTPALNATTTYYAEASRTADGCVQAVRTPATVTVTPAPAAPVVANNNVTVCSGSAATFTITPVAGVTYNWFSAATGGTSLATGNSFTTPALTATTSYYVEAENSGLCSSSTRTKVTATVTTTPLNATVTPATQAVCAGSPAVLVASSSQPGVTFNWYTAATGGTPIFTGAQYTTPALTANATYYVEVVAGSCTSPARTRADVTVNPLPAAPTVTVTPAGGQITSGQTATLTASSTTANVTYNWYTASSGGSPIATGATFTTPALSSNTTYYVEAVSSSTGCISATRTPVTVIVNPIFSTSCDFASTQTNSNSGVLCVGCTVINPDNAVDTDTTNFSQLSLPVGAVGYQAQKLIFGDSGLAGDTVTVKISIPVSLATAGVLNQLQIGSFNGNTDNGDRINLSSNLITLRVLSGGQTAIVKFVPKAAYNAVELRLTSTLSLLNSLNIYYATKQVPMPQVAVKTQNICAGNTATFAVSNPVAGVTYKWYTAATGGTAVFTGATFTTPALNATTTYYVEASRTSNGCANPNRVAVTANVTPLPVTPVLAQNAVSICAGDQVTLTVTNANGATVNWYDAATNGTLLFTGASYTVSPIATAKYYAELSNGTCTSSVRTVATVTVNPKPSAPGVASPNVTVCAGSSATLAVLTPDATVTYDWFTAATGGTAVATGATFTTPAITQNTTYYVQATSAGGCVNNGGRTAVNITISPAPAPPTLSATSTTVCNGGSATISVTNPVSGVTYNWYTAATGGTSVFTGTTFTQNGLTASVSYYVEASNSMGCISATRARTDIIVQPVPTAPQVAVAGGSSVCSGASASLSIVNPQANTVYRWYDAAAGGTLLTTGTSYNTPALTATTSYYVEASQAGNCNPSARTQVTITVNPVPATPVLANADVSVCKGSTATLSIASPQAGITYQWFDSAAMTNKLAEGATFTTGAITANTTFYVAAVNASGCVSNTLATAQVNAVDAPAAPAIAEGNTVQTCSGTTATLNIAAPQTGFTYNWYTAATGGTPVATGNSFTTPVLTASVTYYAEAVNGTGCSSASRTAVTINVNALPTPPVVTAQGGGTTAVCSGSAITLNATSTTANVTFNWYTTATGGTPIATGASFTTPALTATTSYFVEAVSASGCSSSTRTQVTVTVNDLPADPTLVSANVNVCSGSTATFVIKTPQTGVTYQWFDSPAQTNKLAEGVTFTTGPVTANTIYYVVAVNATGCQSKDLVLAQATVQQVPGAPVVANGNTQQACSGTVATLSIANPQAGITYNWYADPTGGTALASGTSFTTPSLTATTTYYVDATNSNSCTSSTRTAVTINVNPIPTAPVVTVQGGGATSVCPGTNITLNATSTTAGVTFNWYNVPTGGTLVFSGASFTTPALTATTDYYVEAVSASGCSSDTRTKVTITVNPAPADPTLANANVTICKGSTATLSIANPQNGVTYQWFDSAAMTNKLAEGTTFTTPALTANTTYYVGAVNASGCRSTNLATAQVTVQDAPDAPVIAGGNTQQTCSGSTATIAISNPQTGYTYNWYANATGGAILASGTSFTTPSLTATTTYYVEAVNAGGCNSATRTAVTINVTTPPAAPVVTVQGGSNAICSGATATLNATSTTAGVTFNWYNVATGGTPISTGASFTTPALTATTDYYVEAVSNTGGCVSDTRTKVTITVNPAPADPTLANANVTICKGSTATLSIANPQNGVTYQWFDSAAMTNKLAEGATFTTPALTANTTYYVGAVNASGCRSTNLATAQVTVQDAPDAPVIAGGNTQQTCSGSTATIAISNPQTGYTYNWYANATGGTVLASGTSFTTPALTATTTYYVEAVNAGGCNSATRTAVTINVTTPPAAPVVTVQGGSNAICSGATATLNATSTTAGVTFNWYTAAIGGTPIASGASFTTPALTATTDYYVEAVSSTGGCVSDTRTKVTVTVNLAPADPTLTNANVTICKGSTATLSIANLQTGVTYQWFDSAAMTNKLAEGATFTTPALTANTTYYVGAVNASGCRSTNLSTAQVTVVDAPAAPVIANGNTVQSCSGSTATVTIANPQAGYTYSWYANAAGGTALATGTSFTTPVLTANAIYYVEAANAGGCSSATRTAVDINVNQLPTAPVVTAQGGNATVCSGNTITLNATSTTANVTFNWYTVDTGGTPIYTGASYTTGPITATTTFFVEAVSNVGGCASATRTAIQVTTGSGTAPMPGVNAADLTICQNTAATIHISNPDAGTVYNWYTVATGGSAVYTGTAFTTPVLTANTTYYVEASNSQSCNPSARLAVNVVIVPQPGTPVPTSANVSVCRGSGATLSVQSPQAGITYNWYDSATRNNLLFTGPTFNTPAVTANTTYYVDASNGSCSSSSVASVTVTVTDAPATPLLVNGSVSTCKGSQVTLEIANSQPGFSYTWYTSASGGTSVYTGTSFTTPTVTATTNYYAEAVNATGCSSATRAMATVTVNPAPAAPQVNAPGSAVCPGSTVTLNANNTDATITINWYTSATGGTAVGTGNSFTTPALNTNTTYYAEAVNSTGCKSASRTAIQVKVYEQLAAPIVTVAATTSSSVQFIWDAVSGATGYEYSLNNGATFTQTTDRSYTVTGMQPAQTATIIVRALGISDCQTSANSAAVTGTANNPQGNDIFIPNAFSPNGDGNNDIFYVYGTTIKTVSMWIYDQWGSMMFTSNSKSAGWDGTYKGRAQPVGVYVYYVEITLDNGQIVKRKGTINLLR